MDADEKVIFEGYAPIRYFLFNSIVLLFLTIFYGAGFAIAFFKSRQLKIKITTRRIDLRFGIFSHTQEIIDLSRVKDVSYDQSFVGRLFNFGVIGFQTTDRTAQSLRLPMINPKQWVEKLREEIREESGDEATSLLLRNMKQNLNWLKG